MKNRHRLLGLTLICGVEACSHAHVQTSEAYVGPPMPRPDHIYVSYFSITPDEVRLDQGIGARIMRAADDQSPAAGEMKAAQDSQAALANGIVDRLQRYGLPAEVVVADPVRGSNDLLVQGQIVSIDQGNRTRRTLIGLGAGKSSVMADAQIYRLTQTAPPRFLTALEGQADSGDMPGAAETMGAGAAAQRIGTSAAAGATHAGAETRRTSETAEAASIADQIAMRIGQLAVAQG